MLRDPLQLSGGSGCIAGYIQDGSGCAAQFAPFGAGCDDGTLERAMTSVTAEVGAQGRPTVVRGVPDASRATSRTEAGAVHSTRRLGPAAMMAARAPTTTSVTAEVGAQDALQLSGGCRMHLRLHPGRKRVQSTVRAAWDRLR